MSSGEFYRACLFFSGARVGMYYFMTYLIVPQPSRSFETGREFLKGDSYKYVLNRYGQVSQVRTSTYLTVYGLRVMEEGYTPPWVNVKAVICSVLCKSSL